MGGNDKNKMNNEQNIQLQERKNKKRTWLKWEKASLKLDYNTWHFTEVVRVWGTMESKEKKRVNSYKGLLREQ